MTINLKNKLTKPLERIWKEFEKDSFCTYSPHALAEIPDSSLLFIGINPSLPRTKEERQKLMGTKPDFGSEENMTHKYFKKFFEIGNRTRLEWGHLDIFYLRETNQSVIKKLLGKEKSCAFLRKQWELTQSILTPIFQGSKKRIVVVNNSLARDILKGKIEELGTGYALEWKEELGTYTYRNTVFFFTSMLTGQRALDLGSFERLVWHINWVKEKWQIS